MDLKKIIIQEIILKKVFSKINDSANQQTKIKKIQHIYEKQFNLQGLYIPQNKTEPKNTTFTKRVKTNGSQVLILWKKINKINK